MIGGGRKFKRRYIYFVPFRSKEVTNSQEVESKKNRRRVF